MCGRFTLTTPTLEELLIRFSAVNSSGLDYLPRYNIAPSQSVLSVINHEGSNRLGMLHWGLIPFWAKDPSIGNKMINARAETVSSKPAYKRAFASRRCLIIADGFYEWARTDEGKQPFRFTLHNNEPFAMAGLWEKWVSPEEQTVYSCTIITTVANELVSEIHPRMPVILHPEDESDWLESIDSQRSLLPLLTSFPSNLMKGYPVSKQVNSPLNETMECITPL